MNTKSISVDDAVALADRHPAIVLGPGATSYSGALDDLTAALRARLPDIPLPKSSSAFDLADIVESLHPEQLLQYRNAFTDELNKIRPSADLAVIADCNWVACVSLTPDTLFERALQNRLDMHPSSRTVTLVANSSVIPPTRTIPIYRLLGIPGSNDESARLVYSAAELLLRQNQWAPILSTFPDFLKHSVLFFLGTSDVPELAAKFLATIYSGGHPRPSTLIFLKGDPIPSMPMVAGLLRRSGASIYVADGTTRDLVSALERGRRSPRASAPTLSGPGSTQAQKAREALHTLRYLADAVPARTDGPSNANLGREIVDSLFRPTGGDWRPYQQSIDLPRSMHELIVGKCREVEANGTGLRTIAVHGAAGVGKTTILRRLAVTLASGSNLVLWCHRAVGESTTRMFRMLTAAARDVLSTHKELAKTLYIFVDDPWSLRISPADVMAQIEASHLSAVLIVGARTSDIEIQGTRESILPGRPDAEFEVPHVLDSQETARLPQFLVGINAASTIEQAQQIVDQNPYRNAADVLCSLWFLIPDTRSQLQASLEDEYGRLGDARAAIEGVAAGAVKAGDIARTAYEAVTAVSSLGVGLPVEVLVRGLDIDYKDWLPLAEPGKPLWGLLYDEYEEASESYVYRTRNEIVTRVLLRLVNGVLGGHSGQFRLLRRLLAGCTVATPAYRGFVHDILIRSRTQLEELLSFEQGLELYDAATAASPHPDRSLEHHKGLWIKNVGRDLARADSQLQKALEVADYPGASRTEPREYVHTSIAATVLAEVRDGILSRDVGFERVTEHLRRANTGLYFNANQSHVLARTYYEMAQISSNVNDPLRLACLNESLAEIERSLQMIGAAGRHSIRHQKALEYFGELQNRVIESVSDEGNLAEMADEMFRKSASQAGYELQARRLLSDAGRSNVGTDYNLVSTYLSEVFRRIETSHQQPSSQLIATRVDLIIRWRLQQVKGAVDWLQFGTDLEQLLRTPRYRDDPLKKFYFAVSLYQQGKITEANAVFSALRRISSIPSPRAVRCYYIGPAGFPKRFQGMARHSGGRDYVTVDELGDDILAHGPLDTGPGGTLHVYVAFTSNGPLAVTRTAGPGDLLLPAL